MTLPEQLRDIARRIDEHVAISPTELRAMALTADRQQSSIDKAHQILERESS